MTKFPYAIEPGKVRTTNNHWPPYMGAYDVWVGQWLKSPPHRRDVILWCANYMSIFWMGGHGLQQGVVLKRKKASERQVDWGAEFQKTLQRYPELLPKMQEYYCG